MPSNASSTHTNHAGPAGQNPSDLHCCQKTGCSPAAGLKVGGIVGERGDQPSRRQERQAQPDEAIAEEAGGPFALEALPDKKSGNEKHQRHKEDVVEADQQREAAPALWVDHRE
jgi:hypothetical protein